MELFREYNSIALATGVLLALYGLYQLSSAGTKNREKRLKGIIEAVMGAIVFVVALFTK